MKPLLAAGTIKIHPVVRDINIIDVSAGLAMWTLNLHGWLPHMLDDKFPDLSLIGS